MKYIPIDALLLSEKQSAHEYLKSTLGFPAYYGRNLDALADSLSELDKDTAIIIMNSADITDCAERIIEVFLEILAPSKRIFIIK